MSERSELNDLVARAGLSVAWRTTDDGHRYAGFRLVGDDGLGLGVTLLWDARALWVAAPELPEPPALGDARRLPLGQLFHRSDTGLLELAVGIAAGPAELALLDLGGLLRYLVGAVRFVLDDGDEPPARPPGSTAPASTLLAAVRAAGPSLEEPGGTLVVRPDGLAGDVRVRAHPDGWYTAAGVHDTPLRAPAPADPRWDWLQSLAAAGRYVADDDGRVVAELCSPLPASSATADDAVRIVVEMLRAAASQLSP